MNSPKTDTCQTISQTAANASNAEINASTFVSGLSRTLAQANAFITDLLHQKGLSNLVTSHGDILVTLFNCETITMQELAQSIGRDPSTVTTLVKKLVAAGYIETQKNPDDRRSTNVFLTEKGKALHHDFDEISSELVTIQMKNVDPDDFAITCKTLHLIRNNFKQANEK